MQSILYSLQVFINPMVTNTDGYELKAVAMHCCLLYLYLSHSSQFICHFGLICISILKIGKPILILFLLFCFFFFFWQTNKVFHFSIQIKYRIGLSSHIQMTMHLLNEFHIHCMSPSADEIIQNYIRFMNDDDSASSLFWVF